jgi:predicted lipoprotein with Yx(FWY)xxD motif
MPRFTPNAPAHTIRRVGVLTGAVVLALALGAQAMTVAEAAAAKHPAILVSTAKNAMLGNYLETVHGKTLYTFTLDTPAKSNCTGECAVAWPPLLVPKGVKLSELVRGVKLSRLGKIKRPNGTFQLTYEGKPLYRFAGDKSAGQTTGQGFANDWFVALVTPVAAVTPTGATPVATPTPQASSTGSSGSSVSHGSSGSSSSSGSGSYGSGSSGSGSSGGSSSSGSGSSGSGSSGSSGSGSSGSSSSGSGSSGSGSSGSGSSGSGSSGSGSSGSGGSGSSGSGGSGSGGSGSGGSGSGGSGGSSPGPVSGY